MNEYEYNSHAKGQAKKNKRKLGQHYWNVIWKVN